MNLLARVASRCILTTTLVGASTRSHAAEIDSFTSASTCLARSDRAPQRDELLRGGAVFLESEHFVVAYQTSGPDSIHHPDLVPTLLEDLEHAYRVLSTDPRCAMRPPYGTYEATDGRRKIEGFIEDLHPDADGRAHAILANRRRMGISVFTAAWALATACDKSVPTSSCISSSLR
jgi:hypothetical protein